MYLKTLNTIIYIAIIIRTICLVKTSRGLPEESNWKYYKIMYMVMKIGPSMGCNYREKKFV